MNKHIEYLMGLIRSKSLKASGLVLGGQAVTAASGFIFTVIVSRKLGPEAYGLFALCMIVFSVLTELSDLGLKSSVVRFVARYIVEDKEKAEVVLKVAFKLRTCVSLFLFAGCLLFARNIAVGILKSPDLVLPIRVTAFGILFLVFFNYITSILQAYQDFGKYSFLFSITGIIRIAGTLYLFLINGITLISALVINVATPFVGSLIGWLWIPKKFLSVRGDEKEALVELFHFGKWMIVVAVYGMIQWRMDAFMLNLYCSKALVGHYWAAAQLNFFVSIVIGSVMTVLYPVMSSKPDNVELEHLLSRVIKIAALASAVVVLPAMALSGPVITGLLGAKYAGSVIPFNILLVDQLFILVFSPVGLLFLSLNKPRVLTLFNGGMLVCNVILNFILIPRYQAVGAALSTTVVHIVGLVLFFAYARVTFGREQLNNSRSL